MAKPGKQKRRIPGMVLELHDGDKERLAQLVVRYQKQMGGAFKSSKVFVIRQLLRHASIMKRLPPIVPDDEALSKPKNALKGMVVELESEDTTRLTTLVESYESAAAKAGYRSSKALVIRQLLRYADSLKELPPLRGQ